MALTRRGRRVRAIIRFVFWVGLILLILWGIDELTTPKECEKPFNELSQFCLDLLYP